MIFLLLIFPISCFWSSTATIITGDVIINSVIAVTISGTTVVIWYKPHSSLIFHTVPNISYLEHSSSPPKISKQFHGQFLKNSFDGSVYQIPWRCINH